jgi:hypothetical protein
MDEITELNCGICRTELPEGALFCGECGSSVTANPEIRQRFQDVRTSDTVVINADVLRNADALINGSALSNTASVNTLPSDSEMDGASISVVEQPASAHNMSAAKNMAPVYELLFSTGEKVIVSGSGLVGRRPHPHQGEFFDHLVQIVDPERSVSKTHFEFGYEAGMFWIIDRFSGNGSVIRRPNEQPVCVEPGRRYRVPRGARIEIGDQFVDVS